MSIAETVRDLMVKYATVDSMESAMWNLAQEKSDQSMYRALVAEWDRVRNESHRQQFALKVRRGELVGYGARV